MIVEGHLSIFGVEPDDEDWFLWVKLVLSIGLTIGAAIVSWFALGHFVTQWSSHSWPKAVMTITAVGDISKEGTPRHYAFEVDGVRYAGVKKTAQRLIPPGKNDPELQKYAIGTVHDIYYKPGDPGGYSVLEPGGNFVMQGIGTLMLVPLGVVLVVNARRQWQEISSRSQAETKHRLKSGPAKVNGFSRRELEGLYSMTDCSDPGLLRLDEALLKCFHPEWYPTGASGLMRMALGALGQITPREAVKWHLLLGDRSPAIVISVEPFCVAAYTEGIDCVVILKFDSRLIPAKFKKHGTKLVTLNLDYSNKFGPLAADLTPGNRTGGHWTNFLPLIGEFLSSETERLEELKRSIPDSWWQRTARFAKNYDVIVNGVRDGRPGSAAQPSVGDHTWRLIDRGS